MVVTKAGFFRYVTGGQAITREIVRNRIVDALASLGLTPVAVGTKSGAPCAVYRHQFSPAVKGTVFQEIVIAPSSQVNVTSQLYVNYNTATFTGTETPAIGATTVYQLEPEGGVTAYYRPGEFVLFAEQNTEQSAPLDLIGLCRPITKSPWWNEDLFCFYSNFFLSRDSASPQIRSFARGVAPNFTNPFPNSSNVFMDISMNYLTIRRNPLLGYDIVTQLPVRAQSSFDFRGYVGRFSEDLGYTASEGLDRGRTLTLSESEEYIVVSVNTDGRATVLRTV